MLYNIKKTPYDNDSDIQYFKHLVRIVDKKDETYGKKS